MTSICTPPHEGSAIGSPIWVEALEPRRDLQGGDSGVTRGDVDGPSRAMGRCRGA